MGRKRPRRRPVTESSDAQMDPPPLGGSGQRAKPMENTSPAIARQYDPGFKPPADDDPWQDEGHPEASG